MQKAEEYPVEFTKEKRMILAEKAKYEEFRREILELDTNKMTPDQLQHKIDENHFEIVHNISEMNRLYNLLKEFWIFARKYQYLNSQIEVSRKFYSHATKENLLKTEKPLKITIEEIKSLLEEAHKIHLDLSMYILPLQEKINQVNRLQDFVAQLIHQPSEIEDLCALKTQILQLGILTPEIALINDKVIFFV
mgnify:CR=1 FL=1